MMDAVHHFEGTVNQVMGDGALGGVGTKPRHVPRVEKALAGATLDPATLRWAAALAALRRPGHDDFKIELMQRVIVRAIETVGASV